MTVSPESYLDTVRKVATTPEVLQAPGSASDAKIVVLIALTYTGNQAEMAETKRRARVGPLTSPGRVACELARLYRKARWHEIDVTEAS